MNDKSPTWPYLLGAVFGVLVVIGFALVADKKQEWKSETMVHYTSGEARCFEGMKHTVDDGFVLLYDREEDISIPESNVVSVRTSKKACK